MPAMPTGVSRDGRGSVTVLYGERYMDLSEELYREAMHQPWLEDLPIVEKEAPRL